MLSYDPKDASQCLPEGDYDAVISNVEQTKSKKSGKDMQIWTITVYAPDGREVPVKDYVVVPDCVFKIKQLAVAFGRRADFEARRFQAEEWVNQKFRVTLTIESQDGYDDQNKVKRYLPASAPPPKQSADVPGYESIPGDVVKENRSARQAAKQPAMAAVDDSDIPF